MKGSVGRRCAMSRKPAKTQHSSTKKPKRNNAPTAAPPASSTVADLQEQVSALTRELAEAREQQSATSEVLRIISNTPSELDPALKTILANATNLCQATFGVMYLVDGRAFRTVATHNAPQAFAETRRRDPTVSMTGKSGLARLAATKQPVYIADVAEDLAYRIDLQRINFVTQTGARSILDVPMLKGDELIGAICVYRQEVRQFTDKQIALLTNFAAQAVIAIENTRLLNELRERTDDLTESLEQQTATSEVLQVISSSPGDLQPVFATMLENAVRVCGAHSGNLLLREDGALRIVAMHGAPSQWSELRRREPTVRPPPQ